MVLSIHLCVSKHTHVTTMSYQLVSTLMRRLQPIHGTLLYYGRKNILLTVYTGILILQRLNQRNLFGVLCWAILYLPSIPCRHIYKLVLDLYDQELYANDFAPMEQIIYDILYYTFNHLTVQQTKLMTDISEYVQDKLRPYRYPNLRVERMHYDSSDSNVWIDFYGTAQNITSNTRIIYFAHGGAYAFSGSRQYPGFFNHIITYLNSHGHDCRVASLQYKLTPKYSIPSPIIDGINAYDYITDVLNIQSHNIIMSGDSCGGHLVMSVALQLRDTGRPIPGGLLLLSPWLDSRTEHRPFYDFNFRDYIPKNSVDTPLHWFIGNKDTNNIISSPAIAELDDIPNILVWYAQNELLSGHLTPWLTEQQQKYGHNKIQKIVNRRLYHVAIILCDVIGGSLNDDLQCILIWLDQQLTNPTPIINSRPRIEYSSDMIQLLNEDCGNEYTKAPHKYFIF